MSLLGRLRESLSRTKQQIVDRFDAIVRRADDPDRRARPIDVETIEALEELLISADLGVAATDRIIAAVKDRARGGASLRERVKDEIRRVFEAVDMPLTTAGFPEVTLIVGVKGTCKATTVGIMSQPLMNEVRQHLI